MVESSENRFRVAAEDPAADDPAIAEWARELNGRILSDRYQLGRLLGYGGTGGVFRGRHLRLGKTVAIKVLHEELSFNPEVRGRFDREAHAASRLSHPNCIEITDVGKECDLHYLVMPFVEGVELEQLMGGKPMEPQRAIALVTQVLAALEHAHSLGIIHRDVKPENVLVVHDYRGCPQVKLLDFGIAKVTLPGDPKRLTRAGQVFGTPQYMSPEQARGAEVTPASDIYSTGLILYELLTGLPVYDAEDPLAQIRCHLSAPPPQLTGVVPDALVPVLAGMLAKDPKERFPSASAVRAALERAQLVASWDLLSDSGTFTPATTSAWIRSESTGTKTLPSGSCVVSQTLLAATPATVSTTSAARRRNAPEHEALWILAMLMVMLALWTVLGVSTYLLMTSEIAVLSGP
ncbi:MAG: serine/threonine-protein kinase [Myxococcota bacterium]